MDLGLHGRTVLVAGGDRPTVEACTRTLRAEGAHVSTAGLAVVPDLPAQVDGVVVVADAPTVGRVLDVTSAEQLRTSFAVVTSAVDLYRSALPGMVERGHGRLVVVTTSGVKALADEADELAAVSGLALLGMHKAVVADVARDGVTANAVLRPPGADPEDVAAVVAFLLSAGAGYLQGTTIALDGATSPAVF